MSAQTFTLGQLVRLNATFTQNSALVEPSTVTLIIDEPDGVELVLGSTSIVNPGASTGLYYYDYSADKPGPVEYRWKSAAPQGAKENYFIVEASRVANPLANP